ncbi:hypothetical protein GBA65_11550 [Rubrobacter marinus]|uniref:Yip1 domain-containing protein n=1 Tax=Rubrobacter marinus TaxID=2653852 RepID=A0A6G8PXV5_9ACTN|nr:YIP1 family protein [Rubrobacter marinus]QIN79049.1 hypothetical protein GBA65_11550 [Rubrobacter marinus]
MDFNTGRGSGEPSRRPDDSSSPLFGSGETGPPRSPAGPSPGGSGGEFSLSDPINSFVRTTVAVLTRPKEFFRGMSRQGDFINPGVYGLICGFISALLGGLVGLVFGSVFSALSGAEAATGIGGFLVGVILAPIFTAIGLLITAGVYHLLVLLLVRPSNGGFEATFRVVCYVSAIQLLTWIPIVNIIAAIYGLYVAYFGIREVHATTNQRAAAVVALPVLVVIFFIIFVTGAAILLQFA